MLKHIKIIQFNVIFHLVSSKVKNADYIKELTSVNIINKSINVFIREFHVTLEKNINIMSSLFAKKIEFNIIERLFKGKFVMMDIIILKQSKTLPRLLVLFFFEETNISLMNHKYVFQKDFFHHFYLQDLYENYKF